MHEVPTATNPTRIGFHEMNLKTAFIQNAKVLHLKRTAEPQWYLF